MTPGIVVDGIPIPDSASFLQVALAKIHSGDGVPHRIIGTIVFEGDTPVLATGSIGSSLVPKSLGVLLGMLGQHQDLATLMRAPPLLSNISMSVIERPAWQLPVPIPLGAYSPDLIAKLKQLGLVLDEIPSTTVAGLRGTLAAVSIDPKTGQRTAVDQPGLYVFNSTE